MEKYKVEEKQNDGSYINVAKAVEALKRCFPKSFVNRNNEFIAHVKSNSYFILKDCENEMDIKCKVLEWLSRPASKGILYEQNWRNKAFQDFMLKGINDFLGTSFSHEDMEEIYTYIGNACNHRKTVVFVESGYDMDILPLKGKELDDYIDSKAKEDLEDSMEDVEM